MSNKLIGLPDNPADSITTNDSEIYQAYVSITPKLRDFASLPKLADRFHTYLLVIRPGAQAYVATLPEMQDYANKLFAHLLNGTIKLSLWKVSIAVFCISVSRISN